MNQRFGITGHRVLWACALLAVVLSGLFLRTYRLDEESPWSDEIHGLSLLDAPDLIDYLEALRQRDTKMVPLYPALQYSWSRVFGASVLSVRLLSVLFGTLTIPVLYGIGRRLYGRWAGLVAAVCLAFVPMHIQYSQELRAYALGWFLAVLSVYTFIRLVEQKRLRWWLLHGMVNAALVGTHVFNVFLLPVEMVILLLVCRRAKMIAMWAAIHAVFMISLGVWIATIDREHFLTGTSWLTTPTIEELGCMASWYSGAGGFQLREAVPKFLFAIDPYLKAVCVGVFALASGAACFLLYRNRSVRPLATVRTTPMNHALVLLWAFLPPLLLAIESYVYRPAFSARYVGYCSPALYLMLGGVLAAVPHARLRAAFRIAVIVLLATQAGILSISHPIRTDWRKAAHISSSEPNASIYVNSGRARAGLNYQFRDHPRTVVLCRDVASLREHAGLSAAFVEPFWMVFDTSWNDFVHEFEGSLKRHGIESVRHEFPGRYSPLVQFFCRKVPGEPSEAHHGPSRR